MFNIVFELITVSHSGQCDYKGLEFEGVSIFK